MKSSRTPRRPTPQRRPQTPRKQPPAIIVPETSASGGGSAPPTSFELLQEAVFALKQERRGVSLRDIRRHLLKKYKDSFDKARDDQLTTTLERLAERGKVIYKRGHKFRFKAPDFVTKPKHNRDHNTISENDTHSGADTNSYVSATTATSGGSATTTTAHSEGTNGSSRSLDSPTSASSSQSDTGTGSTGSRSRRSSKSSKRSCKSSMRSKSSKSCSKSTRDTKSTKNTKSSTKSTRSVKRKEVQDEPQDQEKAPATDDGQSPATVEEEAKTSATGDFSSSVAVTGYTTTSKGSHDSSKRRR